jgi:hypothetical protein
VLSKEQFARVTGESRTGDLEYFCNNSVEYTLRGVPVALEIVWDWEAPPGAGDVYEASFAGTKSRIEIRQGAAEKHVPELYVVPGSRAVERRIAALQSRWPGLAAMTSGGEMRITIPDKYRVGHESHFAQVTNKFVEYVNALAGQIEVILVDGSSESRFAALAAQCQPAVRHIRPDSDLMVLANGKVRGVLTGLRQAHHDCAVIADDDVRYSSAGLRAIVESLQHAEVVRPQNYFSPLPWHALLDTARTLINRTSGGDWPGTLAVRRSALIEGGYDGNVLFENLELVRTVEAGGGRACCHQDLMVRRLPPSTRHFWNQRIRQAYDEFARPPRLAAALLVLPALALVLRARRRFPAFAGALVVPMVIAEIGRRRDRGLEVFPWFASLVAPLWVMERGLCAWLAVILRLTQGGVRYNGRVLALAANPRKVLVDRRKVQRVHSPATQCNDNAGVDDEDRVN